MKLARTRFITSILTVIIFAIAGCSLPTIGVTAIPTPIYTVPHGGACVTLGDNPRPPYLNVQTTHDTFLDHSEPEIAQNPNNPLNLVGGSKFFTDPAHYTFKIGSMTSFDGGCTWTDNGVLPGYANEPSVSDISFAFGTHNDVYASVLNTDNVNESGLSVSTSLDGGKTFGQPVSVYDDKTGKVFSDKPWIAVDTTNGPHRGTLYVVWSYDYNQPPCGDPGMPCTQELGFASSTDGGRTFSAPRLIEGNLPTCTNPIDGRDEHSTKCDAVLGATPTIMPDGTVAVAFAYVDLHATDEKSGAGSNGKDAPPKLPTQMLVITSHDGGVTWANPVHVATIHDIPNTFAPQHYRNFSLPAFASDPKTGQLYISWSDETNGNADILLSSSTDGGQTWTAPIRVNDDPAADGANQFQPQIAVAPNGVVSITFFDTRNDTTHRLIDVYLAQSINHGVTFKKNVRVTSQSWDPTIKAPTDTNGLQFIGDYQGLAVDNRFVHAFWNDTRTGDQEIFTAAVPSAQPLGGK